MARAAVAEVRDDPLARLSMLHELYEVPASVDRGYLPFRRAAAAFMNWQLRRGLLNPADDPRPGSPWWRAVNEAFLRDTAEARALAFGHPGSPSRPAVNAHLEFIATPTTSPKFIPAGSLKKLTSAVNGISGTGCCAASGAATSRASARRRIRDARAGEREWKATPFALKPSTPNVWVCDPSS